MGVRAAPTQGDTTDSTRNHFRILYGTRGRVIVRTGRGVIEIAHRLASPTDKCHAVGVLTPEQCAAIEGMGARLRDDYYVLPIDRAAEIFALAAEYWGAPTDANGYDIPAIEAPATEPEPTETPAPEQATEADPARAAARIIYEHGDLLYAALTDYIAAEAQRHPTADPALLQESYEVASNLREHIADVMEALKEPDRWTIAAVAEHIGATTAGSARKTLSRWGVKAVGREAGRSGESLYDPKQVRAARAARPGRGTRTDLKTEQ
ncbi:hypothetical protein [Streptomyces sp. NPDC097610]|uniref:hypothetical protein n=1 Tax=Streptomyces sp. NPDC097610 TaxID=3157227 RepID=UPI003328C03D